MRFFLCYLLPLILLSQEQMQTRTQVLMGTFVSITLPQTHHQEISRSFAYIKHIEASLSTYDPKATLSKLNQTHQVSYDPCLAEALKLSKAYYVQTHGYFDITIGSISKELYHFGEEKMHAPSQEALQSALLNIHGFHIEDTQIRSDVNITIDLGGMGKGYAVDKVAYYLKDQNISEGIIALSGDIRCLNTCEVYLQSPYSEQTFAKIKSKNRHLSISTSGTYRRYATTKEDHHLINPKTSSQGRAFISVSLFTQANNAKIDAYATAVSVMPKEEALTFLKMHEELGYVLVEPDGNVVFGNLKKFLDITWQAQTTKNIHCITVKKQPSPTKVKTSLQTE